MHHRDILHKRSCTKVGIIKVRSAAAGRESFEGARESEFGATGWGSCGLRDNGNNSVKKGGKKGGRRRELPVLSRLL